MRASGPRGFLFPPLGAVCGIIPRLHQGYTLFLKNEASLLRRFHGNGAEYKTELWPSPAHDKYERACLRTAARLLLESKP